VSGFLGTPVAPNLQKVGFEIGIVGNCRLDHTLQPDQMPMTSEGCVLFWLWVQLGYQLSRFCTSIGNVAKVMYENKGGRSVRALLLPLLQSRNFASCLFGRMFVKCDFDRN
jgi:hypothetical protein